MKQLRTHRSPAILLAIAIAAIFLAACGSSTSTSTSTAASAAAGSAGSGSSAAPTSGSGVNRSKFAACLKAHGVTLPQRRAGAGAGGPGATGAPPSGSSTTPGARRRGSFFGGGAGGGFANNPKLRAAFQACGGPTASGARRFTPARAAVEKFVACVKQHGYTLPAPNFTGKGGIFPSSIQSNKTFQAAAKTCQSDLRPAGAPGATPGAPPGGGAGTSTT